MHQMRPRYLYLSCPIVYNQKSSKAVLKPVEEKLLKLQEIALSIEKEAIYTKDREADHRDVSGMLSPNDKLLTVPEELNSRVSWLSVLTIIILLVLGVTQVYYLQTYLKVDIAFIQSPFSSPENQMDRINFQYNTQWYHLYTLAISVSQLGFD